MPPDTALQAEPTADPLPGWVQVAVVSGPPRLLSYRTDGVKLPLGSRVKVPLGPRKQVGYVVGHLFDKPDIKGLRAASPPLDPEPAIDSDLLILTRQVADYYMVPWATVLNTAVPGGGHVARKGPKMRQVVTLANSEADILAAIEQLKTRAPKQADALTRLLTHGPLPTTELPAGVVPRLVQRGWVTVAKQAVHRLPLAGLIPDRATAPVQLTDAQKTAIDAVWQQRDKFAPLLLHGVTGSGKTEVYLQLAQATIDAGQQVLLLTPEIALASRLSLAVRARFGEATAILHSGLSDGERLDEWQRLRQQSDKVNLLVGTRSAVFAPLPRLGLILVDEEHDSAYKQEETPRYNGRDVAILRARQAGVPILLGSATPSLESYGRAKSGTYTLLSLPDRISQRPLPQVELIDLRDQPPVEMGGHLSPPLVDALTSTLEKGEQALLFLNRRGHTPVILCPACGLTYRCRHCHVTVTLHRGIQKLCCHYCGVQTPVPSVCDDCGNPLLRGIGVGTEGLVDEVQKQFPDARIGRMDRDTTRAKNAHITLIDQMAAGEFDILVGTQMMAKGHHLPGVTLVGVISADQGVHQPDFRAAETTFALLTQVAGRAGREERPGRVLMQTYDPTLPSIQHALTHDYAGFAAEEMQMRELAAFPPVGRAVRLLLRDRSERRLQAACTALVQLIEAGRQQGKTDGVDILGPAEPSLKRLRDEYRQHVLLKARATGPLRQVTRWLMAAIADTPGLRSIRLDVDVDPLNLS